MTISLQNYLEAVGAGGFKDLSPTSLALAIIGVGRLDKRYLWDSSGLVISDTEWDVLDSEIALCLDELMSNIVGMIVPAGFSVTSNVNLLLCDGATYNRVDYPALYDVLDATFIVDADTFVVPDLRDRFVAGAGNNYAVGATGGQDSVSLTVPQLPPHTHGYNYPSVGIDVEAPGVPDASAVGNPPVGLQSGSTGAGDSHENRPPFIALASYIVAR